MFTKIYGKVKNFIKENYKWLIALAIVYLVFTIELPYAIYSPGGAVNLNDRVTVEDGYDVDGSFNMAYVSMVKGSIPFLLVSKIIPDWDIVKKDDIKLSDENMDEMIARERLYLEESMNAAVINAYKYAGKNINITSTHNNVSYIAESAKTDLKIGDDIISVNGIKISSLGELKNIVGELAEGEKVNLKIKRDDKERDAYATTFNTNDGMKIGVSIVNTFEYETEKQANIKSKASEMGSSGGLMMSLTVYNKLVEEDITKGKKIVGTGTIDINGNVGEIGGVKYKLIGAVKNKAEAFICPKENYAEAVKVAEERNYEIKIIGVGTFEEAIQELKSM
ncbi:MAG: PDZ domain-containing protein [Bacilli bacterium]|nr:PDZ domain-containing protein [Bacilli bacterium]